VIYGMLMIKVAYEDETVLGKEEVKDILHQLANTAAAQGLLNPGDTDLTIMEWESLVEVAEMPGEESLPETSVRYVLSLEDE
jgi:hypothetical protein